MYSGTCGYVFVIRVIASNRKRVLPEHIHTGITPQYKNAFIKCTDISITRDLSWGSYAVYCMYHTTNRIKNKIYCNPPYNILRTF